MVQTSRPDVLIAGGSLSGIAAALRLRQLGFDPVVADKAGFPRPKLCGEFLGPDAFPVLRALEIFDHVRSHAYGPVERAVFYNRRGQPLPVDMAWISRQEPYAWAVPRERLDALLIGIARERGITVLERTRIHPRLTRGDKKMAEEIAVQAEALESGQQISFKTSVLVDASGRHGGLHFERRPAGADAYWIGLQCHFERPECSGRDLEMFLFSGGYGGIQPISPTQANLCLLLPARSVPGSSSAPETLVRALARNPAAAERLNAMVPASPVQATARLNLRPDMREPLLRIGDAMLTVDPFTGSGMAMALQTGYLAGDVVAEGLRKGWPYDTMVARYRERYRCRFAMRLRGLELFRPILRYSALQDAAWPVLRPLAPGLAGLFR